jgi:hypothetical protein
VDQQGEAHTVTERESGERSLNPQQFAELRERYPAQQISVERDGSYFWIFVDDQVAGKAVILSDAFRAAMRAEA